MSPSRTMYGRGLGRVSRSNERTPPRVWNDRRSVLRFLLVALLSFSALVSTHATWTEVTSTGGTKPWLFITSSSDGTKLAATLTGNMWTSTDSGATWTEVTSTGSHRAWKAILRVWHLMCLDVGGDPAVRQSLVSNDARSSTSFVPTGRAIPVLSVPTRPSRVVLCRQKSRRHFKYSREKSFAGQIKSATAGRNHLHTSQSVGFRVGFSSRLDAPCIIIFDIRGPRRLDFNLVMFNITSCFC